MIEALLNIRLKAAKGVVEMGSLISRVLAAANQYTVWDYGFLKITLFSIGLLFGAYYPQFILSMAGILWPIFLLSLAWILYVTYVKYMH